VHSGEGRILPQKVFEFHVLPSPTYVKTLKTPQKTSLEEEKSIDKAYKPFATEKSHSKVKFGREHSPTYSQGALAFYTLF
jgi:hypothetical protein